MNAFTLLTENGKFNNSEIMKHAHILKAYRRISLGEALKKAWFLAKRQQKEYREIEEDKKSFKPVFNVNNGNVLKSFFAGNHADYINRDSSWR
ncbi:MULTISPECIES: hypothetical protein [Bacteroides]|jgi:hypothetical protein|uniref:hypothetical protein n=1 Tax=Bacteroides TaxID=816 RepID=UPI0032BF2536